jgi:tetratricopeptide (TPR) repeat protein
LLIYCRPASTDFFVLAMIPSKGTALNLASKTNISLERKALDHIDAGLAFEFSENWPAAAEEYREVFALNPAGWVARYSANNNLGYVLIQLGEHEQAVNHCRAAIAINPGRYNAHKNLGLAFQGQGHWKDALMCFVEATRLNPTNARAWQHLEHLLHCRSNLLNQYPELRQLVADMRGELEENNHVQPLIEPSPMYRPADIPIEH